MKAMFLCCLVASVLFSFPAHVTCDSDSGSGSSAGVIIGPIGTIVIFILICYCCYRRCCRRTVIVQAPEPAAKADANAQAIQHFHIAAPAPVVIPQQPQPYMMPQPQGYIPQQPPPVSPIPMQNPPPNTPYANVGYDKVPNPPPAYGV